MFERSIRIGPEPVRLILTACDPNGGGSSALALVSIAMVRGQMAVLAVDASTVRGFDEIREALLKHVTALLRAHASAMLWFAPENNLGSEASHMAAMLRNISRCKCLTEPGKANVQGVRTTQMTKKLYVGEVERHMRCESIGIAQGCLAHRGTLEALKSQLKQVRVPPAVCPSPACVAHRVPRPRSTRKLLITARAARLVLVTLANKAVLTMIWP